jgi:hypothetical protein
MPMQPTLLEEDHARRARRIDRRTEQRTDDGVSAPRLGDDAAAIVIVRGSKALAALGERAATQIRAALDDHACRLAAGVRVDDANAVHAALACDRVAPLTSVATTAPARPCAPAH